MAYTPDPNVKNMRDQFLKSRRDEANQAANTTLQRGEDAIQRRFAAMGASGSGAQFNLMNQNREAAEEQRRKALSDVSTQELQIAEGDDARGFQSREAEVARQFQSSLADKDMGFKRELSQLDQANKLKELDLAERQFALDKDTTEFNKRMAEIEAGRSPDKGFLGNLGGINGLPDAGALMGGISGAGGAGGIAGGIAGAGIVGTGVGAITKSIGIGGGGK